MPKTSPQIELAGKTGVVQTLVSDYDVSTDALPRTIDTFFEGAAAYAARRA